MSATSSTQTSRLAALEASLAVLLEENNRIKAANATLEQRVTAISEQPRASLTPSNKEKTSEPKVPSPEFFSGSRQGLTPFLTQVNMVIGLQPSRYPTEKTKVVEWRTWVANLRGGSAEIPQGRLLRWQMSDSLGLSERPFTPFSSGINSRQTCTVDSTTL